MKTYRYVHYQEGESKAKIGYIISRSTCACLDS